MLKIGVIGCGAIGTEICKAVDSGIINARLVAVYDRIPEHCERLLASLNHKPKISSPRELISAADIAVECASQKAVRELGLMVLEQGKDLMVLSVGAFMDSGLLERFVRAAKEHHCKIYIPSGAVAGIDGLKSASVASIDKVVLSTTKNPDGLMGAPFVLEHNIDLASFREKTLLFEGSAQDAVRAFPANVNIAASLSLAGIGAKETQVRVFVDPEATKNIHELVVEGDFGKFTCRVENIPSPDNPKTSFLAALSAIATLKKITEPLQIGT
ncbi:MAG: aspartate dehydrogenase [Candidatus Methanoperedenaceae archaeon]|nr:aspartate dehydrogenase [Candidatus Methanoperedenaceae archaeon]